MDYDYRNRAAPYDSRLPMYSRPPTASSAAHAPPSSLYPRIGQQPSGPPPVGRAPSLHPSATPSSSGLGIRVGIKPEYRITPPPQLTPLVGDIPHNAFQFDFDFERKVLAEAEKESQNWNRVAALMEGHSSSRPVESTSTSGSGMDPLVGKYVASGLGREAVSLAVANYGDNPAKVQEFVKAYNLLREMGFSSKNVAEVLAMYDNDTDKALAHFLNSSS